MSYSDSDYYSKDTSQTRYPSHNDNRQQRNDRPPRFHRDTDFPKPGQKPASPFPAPQASTQGQQWKGQDRGPRGGTDRWQNDRRETRGEQTSSSCFSSSTFPRSKDPIGTFNQRSRDGDGGGGGGGGVGGGFHQAVRENSVPELSNRRGPKDNAHASKPPEFVSNVTDGRGGYKRGDSRNDRNEEPNSNRRRGKNDRPNSDHFERQRDSGPLNCNSWGGKDSTTTQDGGMSRDSRAMRGDLAHLQNGDSEHKRTGPIKQPNPPGPSHREELHNKNAFQNMGTKKRTGQGKGQGPKGQEKGHLMEQSWKPGDQCLALYWEDGKVD